MSRLMLTAAALLLAVPAAAQQEQLDEHNVFIKGGVLFGDMRTSLRVDGPNTSGSTVSLEDDLGLKKRPTVAYVEAGYRFAPNWRVTFEYLSISRSNDFAIRAPIQIGDTLYNTNAVINTRFSSDLYKVQVGWSPVKTRNAELGVSLGAHITDFRVGVSGAGTVNGQGFATATEQRSVLAPLPNIGAFGHIRLGGPFTLLARVNYLQLKIDNVSGGLTDLEALVQWQVAKNFGIAAGYRSLDYRLDAGQNDFTGSVRYRTRGPVVALSAAF